MLWNKTNKAIKALTAKIYPNWRMLSGNLITLYYQKNTLSSIAEVKHTVDIYDQILLEVASRLERKVPKSHINVQLFATRQSYEQYGGSQTTNSHVSDGNIYIMYDPNEIDISVVGLFAHEATHIIRHMRNTFYPNLFLEEGIAQYIQGKVAPKSMLPPCITLPHSIDILSDFNVFYDWYYSTSVEYSRSEKYCHAHAFAHFLINRNGIERFNRLCDSAHAKNAEDCAKKLAFAMQDVYGVTLQEVETEWRKSYTCGVNLINMSQSWLTHSANIVINTSLQTTQDGDICSSFFCILERLLFQDKNIALQMLRYMGISSTDVYKEAKKTFVLNKFDATPSCQDVFYLCFYLAVREAVSLKCHYVGTEHLLIGLLYGNTHHSKWAEGITGLTLEAFHSNMNMYYDVCVKPQME